MERVILFSVLWLACCLYGLVKGGMPERVAALILLLGTALTALVESPSPTRYSHVDYGTLIIDAVGLAALLWLSLRTRRFWSIWMVAMHTNVMLAHLAIFLQPNLLPWAYWLAISLWIYPMLGLLAAATYWHQKRLQMFGSDPAWK
jgi:hypothetical protein